MLLRLGDTILTRSKHDGLPSSSKLCRAGQAASKACREDSEILTLTRLSCLSSGKRSAPASSSQLLFPQSGKTQDPKLATARVDEKRRRPQAQGAVVEVDLELPEAVEGAGPEPTVEGCRGRGQAAVVDGEAARAGPPVRGEDTGDGAQKGASCWIGGLDVEGSGGAPDGPPAGGEDLRAGAVLGGEEGDDVAEDAVGEVADAVADEILLLLLLLLPLFFLQPPLLGSGDHAHGGDGAMAAAGIWRSGMSVCLSACDPK
jgi:hypothetical protein